MKLKTFKAKTKVRKSSGSKVSTIPVAMAQILGIEIGDTLVWELNTETGKMEVYPETE